jgi:uncharacterized protein YdeI (YjbR/CyaY-like superfamily)
MVAREFRTAESFYKWLAKNHDKPDELWIKIHKVGSGLKSITPQGSDRRRVVLGLDRRPSQGLRR